MKDSQLLELSYFINDTYENIKIKIINELTTNKQDYIQYIKTEVDIYIYELSNNFVGDNITLIAISLIYNINIRINNEIDFIINQNQPIDLYLEYKNYKYRNIYYEQLDKVAEVIIKKIITEIKEEEENALTDIVLDFNFDEIYEDENRFSSKWSLWTNNKNCQKSSNWIDTINKVSDVTNIENLWNLFNVIPEPSKLNFPTDYYFFKNDIIPMWEDNNNKDGGKMTIIFKKYNDNKKKDFLDKTWLYTVLGCVGEQFYDSDFICGIVLNVRKHQDRVNIWINTSSYEYINKIGLKWKDIIENKKITISFIKHDNTVTYSI